MLNCLGGHVKNMLTKFHPVTLDQSYAAKKTEMLWLFYFIYWLISHDEDNFEFIELEDVDFSHVTRQYF